MSEEVLFTLLIPLCIVIGFVLAMAIIAKAKRRRKRHRIERGVADYLRQLHSRLRSVG
jgi:hypothetical protein